MSALTQAYANGDGTYNGVKMLADLSGLSEAEIKWTSDRIKHLMLIEKLDRSEVMQIVKAEARTRPWESSCLR